MIIQRNGRTKLIAGAITLVIMALLIIVRSADVAFSVEPGWHTVIYPDGFILQTILTCLAYCIIAVLLYTGLLKLLRRA